VSNPSETHNKILTDYGVVFVDDNVIKVDFFKKKKAEVTYPLIINPDLPVNGEDYLD
jgi:hypothetical protein